MKCDIIMSHIFHSAYTTKALDSIGSGYRIILIDNSYNGEMKLYGRRNPHVVWVRPKIRAGNTENGTLAWNPLSCSESWNLAMKRAETEWVINVNPDVEIRAGGLDIIHDAIDNRIANTVLIRSQLGFNVWAGEVKWLQAIGGFDTRYRPCGGEDEDMLCQIAQDGLKWGKCKSPGTHMDGGHLNRIDGYSNIGPFTDKWGWAPHSAEFRSLVGGAVS